MSRITDLINESTTTAANSQSRPALAGLTRAVNNLIFTEMVAIQETNMPSSTLYGVKYLNPAGNQSFASAATYMGDVGYRDGIPLAVLNSPMTEGFVFKDSLDVVYTVIKPLTLMSATSDVNDAINDAVLLGDIRIKSEAALAEKFEGAESFVETDFQFDRWTVPVRSRKLKTNISVELLQDLEANKLDAVGIIDDVLSTMISEDINKDIIQSMVTVSRRYKVEGISPNGIIDLTSSIDAPIIGRTLYQQACEMKNQMLRNTSYEATYVLCTTRVSAMLEASGWMEANDDPLSAGTLKNGLLVFVDTVSSFDYLITGCKHNVNDIEHVGSLFYSPFIEADDLGAYKIINDPSSLQPAVGILIRYGLSVNPYTTSIGRNGDRDVVGDDWSKLAGESDMSYLLGVKLPKIMPV
ncbi:gp24 [Aeromonas phage 31]|uniref:Capsid vertex protein n=3 Tax=Biquartavirus 44RR2 TaxID=115987 RepID=Q6U9D8_9CAUD|nr:gp24 [Aeromonas phage 44RR2.8t]YP_238891.1 capsid vertex protein [Aeromonas phage 31]APU00636.1 capsid vertex protein [Aeromonas phage 44RR2.8t.2]APU01056.1 capsid vertex protein [Aeromonas phage 31.2]APU02218.1 capsid vertex protein [Aeromonas phage Riv-10]APU02464.1 capsid vertex protein [Aeromonas phage SW69-9]AAQ81482.1 head vertex protein [Aeromonas phage 44RR2.8t]